MSRFLQKYLNEILGPLLILLGMILLGLLGSGLSLNFAGSKIQERFAAAGAWSSLPLGILFALSFCPISAGLFFAALIPLAIQHHSPILLPALYGIGTALPVIAFAFLIAFGAQYVGKAFNRLSSLEHAMRIGAGILFILVGLYYCLSHIYGIPISPA
jgi:cytochrome c-type biogenesis protein